MDTASQHEKVLFSKLDGIISSIGRVEGKVDKMQEDQHVLASKIVAIETWKQVSRLDEKLTSFSASQVDLVRVQEKCSEIDKIKESLDKLEAFKHNAIGYGSALFLVLTILTQVALKLIVR